MARTLVGKTIELSLFQTEEYNEACLLPRLTTYVAVSFEGGVSSPNPLHVATDSIEADVPRSYEILHFPVAYESRNLPNVFLHIVFRSRRLGGADRDIGEAHIPLDELLFNKNTYPWPHYRFEYQLYDREKTAVGVVGFTLEIEGKSDLAEPAVVSYCPRPPTKKNGFLERLIEKGAQGALIVGAYGVGLFALTLLAYKVGHLVGSTDAGIYSLFHPEGQDHPPIEASSISS